MEGKEQGDSGSGLQARSCKTCGKPLAGRVDQIFCSTPCRNAWHNDERRRKERHIRRVNRILKNNWKILSSLNTTDKTRVPKAALEARNFDFSYHTSILETRSGKTYTYCYDQGYLQIKAGEYLLVQSSPQF